MKYLFTEWISRIQRSQQARKQERRGRRLYAAGEFAKSAEAYRAALGYAAESPLILLNYGLALYKDNHKNEARAAWERALEMSSGQNAYLAEQIEILLRQFG